jgi:hypothetical protein
MTKQVLLLHQKISASIILASEIEALERHKQLANGIHKKKFSSFRKLSTESGAGLEAFTA